ncbi:unnamed protein product [Orchesella dallaii]|uniref:3'-5' exonuclease domain-containing protein n=1 Tax=Orchesella dallaii TaxID=48710 RepID=A0ABP1PWB4_9HEXA
MKVRPGGWSDDEKSSDDDDFYNFDIGLQKTTKAKKKRRNRKARSSNRSPLTIQSASRPGANVPGSSRSTQNVAVKSNKLSFWEKKSLAFEKFGESDMRPQDNYREFLLHRRQINNGKWNTTWTMSEGPSREMVIASRCPELGQTIRFNRKFETLPDLYDNNFMLVNDEESFSMMLNALKEQTEFTLDLEANDDHSYLGMTVLIQVGTKDIDYLIDCFPVTNLLLTQFKSILEDPRILKWVFGCDNDVLWLKRDFLVQLTSAIDVQILFQEILLSGQLGKATTVIPKENKDAWYTKYIGAGPKCHEKEINAGKNVLSFEALVELYYPNCEIDKVAQVADFRPRREEDPGYLKLLKYARDDVHVLLKIVESIKRSGIDTSTYSQAFQLTKKKELRAYARKTYPKEDLPGGLIKQSERDLFTIIMKWRDHHARIIDENPNCMFSSYQAANLIKAPPEDIAKLVEHLKQKRGVLKKDPEGLNTFKDVMFRLLKDGNEYYQKIMSIKCHNCHEVSGHAGWGCDLPWSTQSTKQNLREDDDARHHQNNRRQRNKRINNRNRRLGI